MDTFNNKGLAPGKKALVIASKLCPENIGKIVEVVRWVEGMVFDKLSGVKWADSGWLCTGNNIHIKDATGETGKEITDQAVWPPEYLMPLDDDEGMCDNSSEEQTKEKENAH